tara:strand:- start:454 stop:651 length:198 start_codon:yes stop_codon:yes gene_type:complete
MSKKVLREGMLDTAVKGVIGLWFGSKLIDRTAKKIAMNSPEVKQKVQELRDAIAEFDAVMAEYEK